MAKISNLQLFLTLMKINAVTLGGGYTIVPVIRQEFVSKRGLLDDEDMLDIIAVAQSGPGAMAVSTSYLTGVRLNGIMGGLAAILGSVLPPLLIITVVFFIYDAIKSNIFVRAALRGMSGVIVASLAFSVKDLFVAVMQKHRVFSGVLMLAAFVLSFWKLLRTPWIILLLALSGLIAYGLFFSRDKTEKTETGGSAE